MNEQMYAHFWQLQNSLESLLTSSLTVRWKRWKLKSKQKMKTSFHFVFLLNKVWLAWKKCQRQLTSGMRKWRRLRKLQILWESDGRRLWRVRLKNFLFTFLLFLHSLPRSGVNMNYTFFTFFFFFFTIKNSVKISAVCCCCGVFFLYFFFPFSLYFFLRFIPISIPMRGGTSTIKWGVHKNTTLISPARLLNYFFPFTYSNFFFSSSLTPKQNWKTMRRVIEKIWLYYLFLTVQRCV